MTGEQRVPNGVFHKNMSVRFPRNHTCLCSTALKSPTSYLFPSRLMFILGHLSFGYCWLWAIYFLRDWLSHHVINCWGIWCTQRTAGHISTKNQTGSISLHRHISFSGKEKKKKGRKKAIDYFVRVFFPHNNNFTEKKKTQSGNTLSLLFFSFLVKVC